MSDKKYLRFVVCFKAGTKITPSQRLIYSAAVRLDRQRWKYKKASIRKLEQVFGISHSVAVKAVKDLKQMGLLANDLTPIEKPALLLAREHKIEKHWSDGYAFDKLWLDRKKGQRSIDLLLYAKLRALSKGSALLKHQSAEGLAKLLGCDRETIHRSIMRLNRELKLQPLEIGSDRFFDIRLDGLTNYQYCLEMCAKRGFKEPISYQIAGEIKKQFGDADHRWFDKFHSFLNFAKTKHLEKIANNEHSSGAEYILLKCLRCDASGGSECHTNRPKVVANATLSGSECHTSSCTEVDPYSNTAIAIAKPIPQVELDSQFESFLKELQVG